MGKLDVALQCLFGRVILVALATLKTISVTVSFPMLAGPALVQKSFVFK